ncbi:hypothetical protein B0H21DRAFT_825026 [Amylocystis lapponica]|nr:hypothetical protein B0H21DRAFT_825026 [Amylocystis lapponica]
MHPEYIGDVAASYIRIAAVSIAAYDYCLTLPAEWRFYRGQRMWKLSPGCILFILIRYISVVTLTISNVGYFGHFSPATCHRYYIVAPIFKVLQTMTSQLILGIRTVNIARRKAWVVWTLTVVFVVVTVLQWFTNLFQRNVVQNFRNNCTPGDNLGHISVWLYYVLAMFYDVVTLGISTYYLLSTEPVSGRMNQLVKVMFLDGIFYIVALTASNIFNLILYRTSNEQTQSSGASLGYAVTWIMSQRILIHLRDAAAEHNQPFSTHTRPITSARALSHVMRSQLDSKHARTSRADSPSGSDLARELDVHVQIEHTVTIEYDPDAAFSSRGWDAESAAWRTSNKALPR